jgi:hypothetical protein
MVVVMWIMVKSFPFFPGIILVIHHTWIPFMWVGHEYMGILIHVIICGKAKWLHVDKPTTDLERYDVALKGHKALFTTNSLRFIVDVGFKTIPSAPGNG